MSEMIKRYNDSQKLRPKQAKQIPGLAVNYFDQNSEFQNQFKTKMVHGDPTTYTPKALDYYTEELKTIVITASFQPTEQGIPLNRWSPSVKYNVPGATSE